MKKALAIVLTLSIIAQGMVNLALCAYYQINKNEIAAKFCVNKNKPMMHCDGQCYLGKQLKKAEENEKRQSQSLRRQAPPPYRYRPEANWFRHPSKDCPRYLRRKN